MALVLPVFDFAFPSRGLHEDLLDSLLLPLSIFDAEDWWLHKAQRSVSKRKRQPSRWVEWLELPGFSAKQISVEPRDGKVLVTGRKKEGDEENRSCYEVKRTVKVPAEIDTSKLTCRYVQHRYLVFEAPFHQKKELQQTTSPEQKAATATETEASSTSAEPATTEGQRTPPEAHEKSPQDQQEVTKEATREEDQQPAPAAPLSSPEDPSQTTEEHAESDASSTRAHACDEEEEPDLASSCLYRLLSGEDNAETDHHPVKVVKDTCEDDEVDLASSCLCRLLSGEDDTEADVTDACEDDEPNLASTFLYRLLSGEENCDVPCDERTEEDAAPNSEPADDTAREEGPTREAETPRKATATVRPQPVSFTDSTPPVPRPTPVKVGVSNPPNSSTLQCSFSVQGFKPEDLTVTLTGRTLVVKGNRSVVEENGLCTQESFYREMTLPRTVDLEGVKCAFTDDGSLKVSAPNSALPSPQVISLPVYSHAA